MPDATTATTTEGLHGPYSGLDRCAARMAGGANLAALGHVLADGRTHGRRVAGRDVQLFRVSRDAFGADIRATAPGACQRRDHGRIFEPVHRGMLLPGAAPVRRVAFNRWGVVFDQRPSPGGKTLVDKEVLGMRDEALVYMTSRRKPAHLSARRDEESRAHNHYLESQV